MPEFIPRPRVPTDIMEQIIRLQSQRVDPATTAITSGFQALSDITNRVVDTKEKRREQERVQQMKASHDVREFVSQALLKGFQFVPKKSVGTQDDIPAGGVDIDSIRAAMGDKGLSNFSGWLVNPEMTIEGQALKKQKLVLTLPIIKQSKVHLQKECRITRQGFRARIQAARSRITDL